MKRIELDQKIGDVVKAYPDLMDLLMEFGIDFCCGGHRPLEEAIRQANQNPDDVLAAIHQWQSSDTGKGSAPGTLDFDSSTASAGQILRHVTGYHHIFLRQVLPQLDQLTLAIQRAHGDHHPELFEVRKLFVSLMQELSAHLDKEEIEVFPALFRYERDHGNPEEAREGIRQLRAEHEAAGELLHQLRHVSNHYEVPSDACSSYHLAYQKLQELERNTFEHIHLENNVAFIELEGD